MEQSNASAGVAEKTRLAPPPKCAVLLLNDDFTTKEFVVFVLKTVFHKSQEESVAIMESVHRTGKGIAGVYIYDIAATKAATVKELAKSEGFPLRCRLEEI